MPPREHNDPQHLQLSPTSRAPPQKKHRARLGHQRSVSFSDSSPEIQTVKRLEDFSSEERAAVWYNIKDYKHFKQVCRDAADAMDGNNNNDDSNEASDMASLNCSVSSLQDTEELCTRGIERMTKEASLLYQDRRSKLLEELKFLKGSEDFDPQDLADLFSQYTATSAAEAQSLGKADQDFAMRYLKTERHNQRRRNSVGTYSLPNLISPSTRRQSLADPGIRSRRKMRAETGRLFREEYARKLANL